MVYFYIVNQSATVTDTTYIDQVNSQVNTRLGTINNDIRSINSEIHSLDSEIHSLNTTNLKTNAIYGSRLQNDTSEGLTLYGPVDPKTNKQLPVVVTKDLSVPNGNISAVSMQTPTANIGVNNVQDHIILGKWGLWGNGDPMSNDAWLRLLSSDGKSYYGGMAMDKVLAIQNLSTGGELCVGNTCMNEAQFKSLANLANSYQNNTLTVPNINLSGNLNVNGGATFGNGGLTLDGNAGTSNIVAKGALNIVNNGYTAMYRGKVWLPAIGNGGGNLQVDGNASVGQNLAVTYSGDFMFVNASNKVTAPNVK